MKRAVPGRVRPFLQRARASIWPHTRFPAYLSAAAWSAVTPHVLDQYLAKALHASFVITRRGRVVSYSNRINQLVGGDDVDGAEIGKIALDYLLMRVEVRIARGRALVRPNWTPETSIDGVEHLTAALDEGNGAIVWCATFIDNFPRHAAFANAGYPLVHVSTKMHLLQPGQKNWFGEKVVAPLSRIPENRPLRARIVRSKRGPGGYLRELKAALERNEVVSIVGDLTNGKVEAPVTVLGRDMKMPTGPPSLARSTGAALLPTFIVREGPFRYRVIIEADVSPDPSTSKTEFRQQAVEAFAAHLEHYLVAHPSSAGWWGSRA